MHDLLPDRARMDRNPEDETPIPDPLFFAGLVGLIGLAVLVLALVFWFLAHGRLPL